MVGSVSTVTSLSGKIRIASSRGGSKDAVNMAKQTFDIPLPTKQFNAE
jgi:hypothetical protein